MPPRPRADPHAAEGHGTELLMVPEPETSRAGSLLRLREALHETAGDYDGGASPTVGAMLRPLESEAPALAAALLALPFLSPMSLGPLTAPASLLIVLLGWRLVRRGEGGPLPARLLRVPVPRALHRVMGAVLARVHRWVERYSAPRLQSLVVGRRGRAICGGGMIAGALLLAVPVPVLPLTNTFPAAGILLFSLGWAERDGLMTAIGGVALVLAVAVFAGLGIGVAMGVDALGHVAPMLRG